MSQPQTVQSDKHLELYPQNVRDWSLATARRRAQGRERSRRDTEGGGTQGGDMQGGSPVSISVRRLARCT
eukprot:9467584-Pyramimonas_sp.AAC.1